MGHSSIVLTYCHQYKMQFIVFYHNIKVPWLHSQHSGQEPRRAGGPLTSPSGLVAKERGYGKKKMYFSNILNITVDTDLGCLISARKRRVCQTSSLKGMTSSARKSSSLTLPSLTLSASRSSVAFSASSAVLEHSYTRSWLQISLRGHLLFLLPIFLFFKTDHVFL